MLPFKSQKCRLTSRYAYRVHPITNKYQFHGGIDLVGVGSDQIVAVHDGTVVRSRIVTNKADATWQWGEYIAIQGTDGVTIYYCHLKERLVQVGAKVKAGDVIGIQGMTGLATGEHLHFETRRGGTRINAADYLGIKNEAGTYSAKKTSPSTAKYQVGDKYTIKPGDVYKYSNGREKAVPDELCDGKHTYTISKVEAKRILLKEIMSWVKI